MAIPKSDADLTRAGYKFINGGTCGQNRPGGGCGARIMWYRTPLGKSIPLDINTYEPHFSTCPMAKEFRKAKP